MTEADWLTCTEPERMLEALRGRASDRKLRLFACACCRNVWHLLTDPRSRRAVEVAERYADRLADERALAVARIGALEAVERGRRHEAWAAYWTTTTTVAESVHNTSTAAIEAGSRAATQGARATGASQAAAWDAVRARGAREQAGLLRDVFGNPHRPVPLDPAWLAWGAGTVPKMVQVIYAERRFADLPILADALEEAGCTEEEILAHCRSGGEHVRGCWVIDLLQGRQ